MKKYRVVMQYKNEKGKYVNDETIIAGEIKEVQSIIELGLRHTEQIEVLQKIQDNILIKQSEYLKENINYCPKCGTKLRKNGVNKCSFNAVFTDHKVAVHRQICSSCQWSSVPSINSLFGSHMHPDLIKIQCEEGSKQSYNRAKHSLNLKSCKNRKVNSTMTIHGVIEKVGNYISQNPDDDISNAEPAAELIVQVDEGHIKAKGKNRSFEALTSVVYKPENVEIQNKQERGRILSKYCAASALDDQQEQIKRLTLIAARKEGMTKDTNLVAICDGASNCWSVLEHLKQYCKSVTCILDWFHIAMRFQNISDLKVNKLNELLDSTKWELWHGNTSLFFSKINELIEQVSDIKVAKRLRELKQYIYNNKAKVVSQS